MVGTFYAVFVTEVSQFRHFPFSFPDLAWRTHCCPAQTLPMLKRPRLWIGALWFGWLVCSLLFLSLWSVALSSRTLSILNARQLAMTANLQDLREAFISLQRLPLVLATTLREEGADDGLSLTRLQQLRTDSTPLCRLYWVDEQGQPLLEGDKERPKSWVLQLASSRLKADGKLTTIRPAPPGMEAGRVRASHPDTPESHLLVCSKLPSGEIAIAEMALEIVFDVWLLRPLTRSGLGDSVSVRTLSHYTPWEADLAPPEPVDVSRWLWPWQVLQRDKVWRWQVDTFFGNHSHPFHKLDVQLDNRQALHDNLRLHQGALLVGAALMLCFAGSIWLTAQAVQREVELVEARSRFTAMVSHELRTPITAIDMYLEILRNGLVEDPEKLASYHAILKQESSRLKGLVENLLAAGSLEHGKELSKEPLELHDMLAELIHAQSGEHKITQDFGASSTLFGNREALAGVFSNLIQNALKYGGDPITVRTRTKGAETVVEVEDQGPGIPTVERVRVFEPYYQIGQADSKQAGVGLGLALAKGLVERHQGSITIREGQAGGAVFVVTLPQKGES